jgi:hypothetical protein
VINLEASPEIDVTSLEMLEQLQNELAESGIALHFARVADRVHDLFDRSEFTDRVGLNRIFPGVDYAVDAILQNDASVPHQLVQALTVALLRRTVGEGDKTSSATIGALRDVQRKRHRVGQRCRTARRSPGDGQSYCSGRRSRR